MAQRAHVQRQELESTVYQVQIDKLIPLAEQEAYELAGIPSGDNEARAHAWNRAFHRAMDRMASAKGLRLQAWQGPK